MRLSSSGSSAGALSSVTRHQISGPLRAAATRMRPSGLQQGRSAVIARSSKATWLKTQHCSEPISSTWVGNSRVIPEQQVPDGLIPRRADAIDGSRLWLSSFLGAEGSNECARRFQAVAGSQPARLSNVQCRRALRRVL